MSSGWLVPPIPPSSRGALCVGALLGSRKVLLLGLEVNFDVFKNSNASVTASEAGVSLCGHRDRCAASSLSGLSVLFL